jgi:hypothetical protein
VHTLTARASLLRDKGHVGVAVPRQVLHFFKRLKLPDSFRDIKQAKENRDNFILNTYRLLKFLLSLIQVWQFYF